MWTVSHPGTVPHPATNRALEAIKRQATDDEGSSSGVFSKGISYMLHERDTNDKENSLPEGDDNEDKDDDGDGNTIPDMGESDIRDAVVVDDNPMPVEDVLDRRADCYVGMDLRQWTSAIEMAANRLELVPELKDEEVSTARLYRFPEQLDVKQGELVCFVKYGYMMFSKQCQDIEDRTISAVCETETAAIEVPPQW